MSATLFEPLALPNGSVLPNRLAKAAMEENMAGAGQLPDERIRRLYRRWSDGGAGLIITGNVMVHAEALTGPGGIVLDAQSPLEPFVEWADAAHSGGAKIWMQINHPGRQVRADMPGVAWAPSAVKVDIGKQSKRIAEPVEMTARQIEATVARFATTARRADEAGFDGVEIHAAHGYLISQFLSPLVNKRTDEWGGTLENRARLLIDVVRAVRATVRPEFAVAVKLNSADFQRGGFDAADAARVIDMLAPLGVDMIELSGGSYESPAMSGRTADGRTLAREAYFLELAADLTGASPLPLMLTGGIVRRPVAENVLASGIDLVGMGTALGVDPDLPNKWRHDGDASVVLAPITGVGCRNGARPSATTKAGTRAFDASGHRPEVGVVEGDRPATPRAASIPSLAAPPGRLVPQRESPPERLQRDSAAAVTARIRAATSASDDASNLPSKCKKARPCTIAHIAVAIDSGSGDGTACFTM